MSAGQDPLDAALEQLAGTVEAIGRRVDHFAELLRYNSAFERINAALRVLKTTHDLLISASELVPEDLGPELAASNDRVIELVEHLEAAGAVLNTKIELSLEGD